MEKYPLEALLSVRQYREELAKRLVRSAESALREAEQNIEEKKTALDNFKIWRREEEERRYDAIMNVPMPMEKLESFKASLAMLAAEESMHEEAVRLAEKEREKCRKELDTAKSSAKTASKNTSKIQAHKDIWKEDAKKETERKEDLELEEFRPLSRKGAEAEGEDV